MLPTSIRQPSRLKGGLSQRATGESSARTNRSLSPSEVQLSLGSEATPYQASYPVWSSLK